MYLETKWFGTFLLDEEMEIVGRRLFPEESIEEKLRLILAGEILEEELELMGDGEVWVRDRRLLVPQKVRLASFQVEIHGEDYDYPLKILREAMVSISWEKVKNFKEMELIEDVHFLEQLESFRAKIGNKDDDLAKEMERSISKTRERMEKWMGKNSSNLKEVLGPVLGAKMITKAGSLEKLARMNTSTIQTLGSEKSLFKHRAKPPKHGLLYQHPSVRRSQDRGKAAKTLAKSVALASRRDFF